MAAKQLFVLIVAAVVVDFGAWSPAQAQDGVVHACAKKGSGNLRLVASAEDCKGSETALSWNIQGSTGAPGAQGQPGEPGAQGEAGESSLVELYDANDTLLGVLVPQQLQPLEPSDFWLYNRDAELFLGIVVSGGFVSAGEAWIQRNPIFYTGTNCEPEPGYVANNLFGRSDNILFGNGELFYITVPHEELPTLLHFSSEREFDSGNCRPANSNVLNTALSLSGQVLNPLPYNFPVELPFRLHYVGP